MSRSSDATIFGGFGRVHVRTRRNGKRELGIGLLLGIRLWLPWPRGGEVRSDEFHVESAGRADIHLSGRPHAIDLRDPAPSARRAAEPHLEDDTRS